MSENNENEYEPSQMTVEERLELTEPEPHAQTLSKQAQTLQRNIDDILETTEQGTKISIHRVKPAWCAGWLDTVEYDPTDENCFSLSWLKEVYGGQLYTLKFRQDGRYAFSKSVRIAAPPRDEGVPLEHPDILAERKRRREFALNPSPSQDSKLLEILIPLMFQKENGQSENQLKLALETIKAAKPSTPEKDFKGILEIVELVQNMKGEPARSSGGDDMSTMLTGLVELLKTKNAQPSMPAIPQGLIGPIKRPQNVPPQTAHAVVDFPQQGPPRDKQNPFPVEPGGPPPSTKEVEEEPEIDMSLGEELAGLEVEEINEVLNEAFEKLDPEKQKKILGGLATIGLGNIKESSG
jgi:hypothetical protein